MRPADLLAVVASNPRLRRRPILLSTLNDIMGGAAALSEIDGIHHMDAAQWWDDMDRENGIKLDGYLVLRFTAFVVRYHPGHVAAQIREAFRTVGHPGVTSSCRH